VEREKDSVKEGQSMVVCGELLCVGEREKVNFMNESWVGGEGGGEEKF
jgi:hypothetical protein